MDFPNLIKYGTSGLAAIGALYGGATFTHDHLQQIESLDNDITLISERLEQKILTDRYSQLQQRLWKIEDRYGVDLFEAPGPVKEEHRALKKELESLQTEIDRVNEDYRRRGSRSSGYYDNVGKY